MNRNLHRAVDTGVHRAIDYAKVDEPPVQVVLDKGRIAAAHMVVDVGVLGLELFGRPGKQANHIRFPRPDVHIPRHHLVGQGNLPLCDLHQLQNLLCPLAQKHPLFGEQHLSGPLGAPDEQLFPQLLLQSLELGGEGGLGEVQRCRRPGNTLLSCHRQKIL